jgi:hypothetical protein
MVPHHHLHDYELSQLCAIPQNMARTDLVRWTGVKAAKAPTCDECAARTWETKGAKRVTVARTKRVVRDSALYLCHAHADLWKARDLDQ